MNTLRIISFSVLCALAMPHLSASPQERLQHVSKATQNVVKTAAQKTKRGAQKLQTLVATYGPHKRPLTTAGAFILVCLFMYYMESKKQRGASSDLPEMFDDEDDKPFNNGSSTANDSDSGDADRNNSNPHHSVDASHKDGNPDTHNPDSDSDDGGEFKDAEELNENDLKGAHPAQDASL